MRCGAALLIALAFTLIPAPASGEDRGSATDAAVFYTLAEGDSDPNQLVAHLGIDVPDAFREVLLWNPQLHNIYALTPGTRLRVPGSGPRPAFPAFETDYSKWKIIGSHTSRFVGSPWERVTNIIVSANSVNNFFDNAAHFATKGISNEPGTRITLTCFWSLNARLAPSISRSMMTELYSLATMANRYKITSL